MQDVTRRGRLIHCGLSDSVRGCRCSEEAPSSISAVGLKGTTSADSRFHGVHLRVCTTQVDAARTQLKCTRRACTCETLDGVEEKPSGRGCRRFEVALILSRQGGDCSRGIVLRFRRFGMLSDWRWRSSSPGCSA